MNFNKALYNAVTLFGLAQEKAYYQYCPMANNDEGAYWLAAKNRFVILIMVIRC
ncbi:MAG: hypothetical protein U5L09_03355 [Bacteroidales bacterium]|nr:hypothetical protein [Bacteroidales bacterium]